MKTTFALAAVAGFAAAASAQAIYVTASNTLPADGELVTLEVVLDATDYTDAFGAWVGASFDIAASSTGTGLTAAAVGGRTEGPGDSAIANTQSGPFGINGTWGGRRPPGFPGFPPGTGGSFRFGSAGTGTPVTQENGGELLLTTAFGQIEATQSPVSAPTFNANADVSRVISIYRFTFQYANDMGLVTFTPTQIASMGIYPSLANSASVFVQTQASVSGVTIGIPTPASAALLGLGGLVATRRRR